MRATGPICLFVVLVGGLSTRSSAQIATQRELPPTGPWVAPAKPHVTAGAACRSHVVRDGHTSIQVNVDRQGCNIPGDAANEPSIAVYPTDPRKVVIGWRQFNSVQSDFREAGWGYSHDAGHTWVFRGSLNPGVFGSDPVLVAGPTQEVYFLSINFEEMRLFKSRDGGITWGAPVQVSPGFLDKPWMAIDTTNGIGRGNVYIVCNCGNELWRSTDGGVSWTSFARPSGDYVTTIHVGLNGTVYVMAGAWFSKSEDAEDSTKQPTWVVLDPGSGSTVQTLFFNWCGGRNCVGYPNLGGLMGQSWLVEGESNGATATIVYVLTHNSLDAIRSDPSDMMFVSSADGGMTWDRPHVINDDPPRCNAWQWFGMMSVAPNGRIDAVWNDTRNSAQANLSELFYAYSTDAGATWSTNTPVSPMFDSWVGFPQQLKLGDYYHMVSDNLGVNVAYAATFNGEQDIYFLRIGPWDCNGNGIPDEEDIAAAPGRDFNANAVPDECEYRVDFNGDGLTTLSDFAAFQHAMTGPEVNVFTLRTRPADVRVATAPRSDTQSTIENRQLTIPGAGAQLLDPDHDGDADLHDLYLLQHVFAGP